MNRILSFILIASFFSITFADFFHLQFHKIENERVSKSSSSSKNTNSTPVEDHCEFEKSLNIFSKNNILHNVVVESISSPLILSRIYFLSVIISREAHYFSSLSARGPPSIS